MGAGMSRCETAEPRTRAGERGFAYLWVMLALALLGLGLTTAAEVFVTATQRDKERELLAIGRQFRSAIARYRDTRTTSGKQEYPATLDDLLQDRRFPDLRRYLRKEFVDPMTGKAEWGVIRVAGRIVGVHSLSDRMPIKQDRFEADDRAFRGKQKYSEWVFTHPADLLLRPDGPTMTDRGSRAPFPAPAASSARAP